MNTNFYILVIALFLFGCNRSEEKLPIFGHTTIIENDTIYSTIKPFSFINQDSITITEKTYEDKIYVTDFIFLSCPSICPKMTSELQRVYEAYKDNPNIYFLSHSIDPKRDTIPRLKTHTKKLGLEGLKWSFVTGEKDSIYAIANESYFAAAFADENAPGGYIHSGNFFLIDAQKRIRGVYVGTNPSETEKLITDIKVLLKELSETKKSINTK